MGTMVITGSAGGSPSSQRAKPKRAVRGSRRHAIQKLLHYLQIVAGQDSKESVRAEKVGYTPYLYTVRPGNVVQKALLALEARCSEVLDASVN